MHLKDAYSPKRAAAIESNNFSGRRGCETSGGRCGEDDGRRGRAIISSRVENWTRIRSCWAIGLHHPRI